MKNTFTLLITLICLNLIGQSTLDKTVNINGTIRNYRIYIPQIYSGIDAVPVIFNFHGYTSTNLEQEFYGDFRAIADTANIILIHPLGLNGGSGTFWNTFSTVASSNYDYQFVSQLIDTLALDYQIDLNRIYSTGMSNGGFMSYDLACFMSNKFAAIASVTGSMIAPHLNACNPLRKVPIMEIHGSNDQTVSYSGTGGILASTPIDSLVKFWVNHNQCELIPITNNLPNTNLTDNSTVVHFVYENLLENTSVELYKVINGSHTWPGSIYDIPGLVTNHDFSASKEIWRFFSKYSLTDQTSSLKEVKEINFNLYPNPSNSEISVEFQNASTNEVKIFDINGQVLRLVQAFGQKETIISIEDFSKGIYFVEVEGNIKKLVKN